MRIKRLISTAAAIIMTVSCLTGCSGCSDKDTALKKESTSAETTTATTTMTLPLTVTIASEDEDNTASTTTTADDEEVHSTTTSEKPQTTTASDKKETDTTSTKKPTDTTATTTTKKPSTSKATTTTKKPTTTTTKKPTSNPPQTTDISDFTTQEIINDMGVGINLGNTFESCGSWINSSSVSNYEMAWGSCIITEDIIKGYKNAGFGVVRVPVAWSNMMGSNYQINDDYLERVKKVVTWIIDNDMYVILNVHWDGGWINNYNESGMSFSKTYDECKKKYTAIWTRLCEEFGDFDEHLMFESLNEEGCFDDLWNRWGGTNGKSEAYGLLNDINQIFVDLVRASGKNNSTRHLLIAGYATDIDLTCDSAFKMPNDPKGRCAVSVHYYTPPGFCILTEDADWGKASSTWGTTSEVNALKKYFNKLKTTFVDKGVPVIIGEYGCPQDNKETESIRKFITTVSKEAIAREICPVLWDTFDRNNPTKCFYNRKTCKMNDSVIAENFLDLSDN